MLVIYFPAIAVSCYCLQRVRNNYHCRFEKLRSHKLNGKITRRLCQDEPCITMIWRCEKRYLKIEPTILHFIKELPNC